MITLYREKIINSIIYFVKNTKYCGKTKLLKLLYFLDFMHFKQTGKPVTNLDYYAWEMGPVPKDLYEELTNAIEPDMEKAINIRDIDTFTNISPKKEFNEDYFSNRELKLLENIAFIFKDAKAEDMVESTHLENEPWDKTLKEKGENSYIDYLLSIDNKEESLSYPEAKERMEEREEVYKIFGVK